MKPRDAWLGLAAVATLAGAPGCASEAPAIVRTGAASFTQTIELPPPVTDGAMSLEETLRRRRSTYEFRPDPLPLSVIGQLFWALADFISDIWHAIFRKRPKPPPLNV